MKITSPTTAVPSNHTAISMKPFLIYLCLILFSYAGVLQAASDLWDTQINESDVTTVQIEELTAYRKAEEARIAREKIEQEKARIAQEKAEQEKQAYIAQQEKARARREREREEAQARREREREEARRREAAARKFQKFPESAIAGGGNQGFARAVIPMQLFLLM